MATQHSRSAARMMMAPATILLLGWMLVPLTMTLYFSFKKYLRCAVVIWAGLASTITYDLSLRVRSGLPWQPRWSLLAAF